MIIDLGKRGFLEPKRLETALLLFGFRPDDATICRNELAYFITLNALGCLPDQPAPDLAKWLEPANRPFPLRNTPREKLMGVDGDACRAAIVKRVQEELVPLRELHAQVVREVDEPALLEELQRASILKDEAARRVARCQAEVRATYHRAWRDLVKVLDSDDEKGPAGFGGDEDDNDEDRDYDDEKDGEAVVTAEPTPEAAVVAEPAVPSTGADAQAVPACRGTDDFLPFEPENRTDQSAQVPDMVASSIDHLASLTEGAKSAPSGTEARSGGNISGSGGRLDPRQPDGEQARNDPAPGAPGLGAIPGPREGRTSGHYSASARSVRLVEKRAKGRGHALPVGDVIAKSLVQDRRASWSK